MTIFQKVQKILFGGHFGHFIQISGKMNFPEKNGCQFLNIPIVYHGAKNLKKITHS